MPAQVLAMTQHEGTWIVPLPWLLMQAPSWHSPEHIKLKQLDWNNLRVISAVLGQSVALDFYARCWRECPLTTCRS